MKSWMTLHAVALALATTFAGGGCSQKPEKAAPDLVRDLKDKDEAVRSYAARELGKVGGDQIKEAVRALTEALKDDSAYVRQAAVRSLGAHGGEAKDAIPALQKAQKDKDEGVRLEATEALKKIQGS